MQARQFLQATAAVTGFTVLSRALGVVRESVMAATFGASPATDAFFVALRIPDLLFNSLASFLIAVSFLPVFSSALRDQGDERAVQMARVLAFRLLVGLSILAVLLMASADALVSLMAPGLPPEAHALAVRLSRIMMPIIVAGGLIGCARSVLHAFLRFTLSALLPVLLNLAILGSLLLAGRYGIEAVAWGVVAGVAVQLLALLYPLHRLGFTQPSPRWPHREEQLGRAVRVAGPVLLGLLLGKSMEYVEMHLASGLGHGAVSYLSYATRIWTVPEQIFTLVISSVLFPLMAGSAGRRDLAAIAAQLRKGLRWTLLFVLPASVGMAVLSTEMVQLILGWGAFDTADVRDTARVLAAYSLGLTAVCARSLLNYVFFALQDSRLLLRVGAAMIPLNLALDLVLMQRLSYVGLAVGASVTATVQALVLFVILQRRLGVNATRQMAGVLGRAALAATVMLAALLAVRAQLAAPAAHGVLQVAAQGAVLLTAGALTYGLAIYALRVPEMRQAFSRFRELLQR